LSIIKNIEKLYSKKQDVLFNVFKSYFHYFEWVANKPYFVIQDNIVKVYEGYDLVAEKNYAKHKLISKWYSDNLNDTLWVNIDNRNMTFEEMKDDFYNSNDIIITQVFYFKHME